MSGKKVLNGIYKSKLKGKLMNDTLEQLEQCKKIVALLKEMDGEEFEKLEDHFLLQYFDTYKDIKTSCEVLVHNELMKGKLVDIIMLKWIRELRRKYEEDWYNQHKKEWFEWVDKYLDLRF